MNYNFIDILVSLVLALIMFGVGISISTVQLTEVYKKPKPFIVALSSQMLALPLIAFAIAYLSGANTAIQVGLVILAASPGGATSGFITFLFKGNTALSVTLTSINSILTLFSIPIIVNVALEAFLGHHSTLRLPFMETLLEIFLVTIIPASLGIMLRIWNNNLAQILSKYSKPVLMGLLAIVFFIKIFGNEMAKETGLTSSEIFTILPYCLLLNVSCLVVGYFIPKPFEINHANRLTTAVESGVHNTTLAFLVGGTLLHNTEFAKVALVYAMISFWTALIFCYIVNITNKTDK